MNDLIDIYRELISENDKEESGLRIKLKTTFRKPLWRETLILGSKGKNWHSL